MERRGDIRCLGWDEEREMDWKVRMGCIRVLDVEERREMNRNAEMGEG